MVRLEHMYCDHDYRENDSANIDEVDDMREDVFLVQHHDI